MASASSRLERRCSTNTDPGFRGGARDSGNPSVADLVMRARGGDKLAWDGIVERYAPLIWSICRRHRLDGTAAEDVAQMVWLHLVEKLDNLHEPAALPGWLATTTRRECLRALRTASLPTTGLAPDVENLADTQAVEAEQELLTAERNAALREALADLPPGSQQLIALLIADPPVSYAEISATLGIPIGSIGPNRRRCLDKLRRHPAIAMLIDDELTSRADTTDHVR